MSLVPVPLGAGQQTRTSASPAAILKHPERFDGRTVLVVGKLVNGAARTSSQGKPYWTFDLLDDGALIGVVAAAPPSCVVGGVATVDGVFRRVHVIDGSARDNQIEARIVTCGRPVRTSKVAHREW